MLCLDAKNARHAALACLKQVYYSDGVERRRRKTGVQQSIENGFRSCMNVYVQFIYACMYVRMYGFRKYLAI